MADIMGLATSIRQVGYMEDGSATAAVAAYIAGQQAEKIIQNNTSSSSSQSGAGTIGSIGTDSSGNRYLTSTFNGFSVNLTGKTVKVRFSVISTTTTGGTYPMIFILTKHNEGENASSSRIETISKNITVPSSTEQAKNYTIKFILPNDDSSDPKWGTVSGMDFTIKKKISIPTIKFQVKKITYIDNT